MLYFFAFGIRALLGFGFCHFTLKRPGTLAMVGSDYHQEQEHVEG
jgi:hypothetical protein